jgi:acyl-lipid omega-6 desaturase (Delta-12 desaturase)
MAPELHRSLAQELDRRGCLEVRRSRAVLILCGEIVSSCVLCIALIHVTGIAYALLVFLGGLQIFRWFVLLHECGHKTLFPSNIENLVVGHLCSIICLLPYSAWVDVHGLHHRWVGVIDKDPTQRQLLLLQNLTDIQITCLRIIWISFIPLLPLLTFLSVFWKHSLARILYLNDTGWRQSASVMLPLLLHLFVGMYLGWWLWLKMYLLSYVTFLLIFDLVNFSQHAALTLKDSHLGALPPAAQDAVTRSARLPAWIGLLLIYNFNRHSEHHLYPMVPCVYLNEVHSILSSVGQSNCNDMGLLQAIRHLRFQDALIFFREHLPKRLASLEK